MGILTSTVIHHELLSVGGVKELRRFGCSILARSRLNSQETAARDDPADLVHVDMANVAELLDVFNVLADDLDADVAESGSTAAVLEALDSASFLLRGLLGHLFYFGFGKRVDPESIAAGNAEMPAFWSWLGVRGLISTDSGSTHDCELLVTFGTRHELADRLEAIVLNRCVQVVRVH